MTKAAIGSSVRARWRTWPYEPDIAHVVLVDHHMVPAPSDIERWVAVAEDRGATAIRSGAVFPRAAAAFVDAGWDVIDRLALLRLHLDTAPRLRAASTTRHQGTSRMRQRHLGDLAVLDRAAFGDPWGNDVTSLGDIASATPRHRSRVIERSRERIGVAGLQAFAIFGLSGPTGYVQRLAVHPDAQRRGHGRALLLDGLDWMRRRGAAMAMVNTGLDNVPALALYEHAGFERCPEQLTILEARLG